MRYLLISLSVFITSVVMAQQDPRAKEILDKVSEKAKSEETIEIEFKLQIVDKKEDSKSTSRGILKVKGEKYTMESADSKVFYNGETMWSYMEDVKEVVITTPDDEDADFVDNPSKIFDLYNKDYKYRLIGEAKVDGKWMYEIDLYPKNLNQPYSRFKIFVKKNYDIHMVTAFSKEGVDYSIIINTIDFTEPMDDSIFNFNPSKIKGIEIIDMR